MTHWNHNARVAVMAGFYTILGVICLLKGATSPEFFGRDYGFTGELRRIPRCSSLASEPCCWGVASTW